MKKWRMTFAEYGICQWMRYEVEGKTVKDSWVRRWQMNFLKRFILLLSDERRYLIFVIIPIYGSGNEVQEL